MLVLCVHTVKFNAHSIVNFIVVQRNVVLEYLVPLLQSNLFRSCSYLRGNNFL
jgi:hypothetical protein